MIEKEIWFKNNNKKKLSGIVHIPSGNGPFPAVVICHGFKRDKSQIIPLVLSRNLSVNGFVVLRFDFQNCGQSEGEFEDLTITQEIDDVYSALDYLETLDMVDKSRIGIAGLSLGGSVAAIATASDKRVKTLVAFAPGFTFKNIIIKYAGIDREKWKEKGEVTFYDEGRDRYWTLKSIFWESCEGVNTGEFSEKVQVPTLFIQGHQDQAVSTEESEKFFAKISVERKEFLWLDNCDHQFRQVDALHKAITAATDWFLSTLE